MHKWVLCVKIFIRYLKWNGKFCIASDLQIIHSQNLIHRDLHSGNILQDNLYSAYIADLGLSISANIALKTESDKVCGILPYIAPEVLYGNPYTVESDIYSFGIIMWEIVSGKAVPFNYESRTQFQFQVHDGLRPTIIEGTPQHYIDLMKKCWDGNLKNRPSAAEIYEIFTKWQNSEKFLLELTEFDKILENTENTQTSSEEVYKSEFISYTNRGK